MISLIGTGSGCPESLTGQGLVALQGAGLILGAKRLLEHLPAGCTADRKAVYKPGGYPCVFGCAAGYGHRCFV